MEKARKEAETKLFMERERALAQEAAEAEDAGEAAASAIAAATAGAGGDVSSLEEKEPRTPAPPSPAVAEFRTELEDMANLITETDGLLAKIQGEPDGSKGEAGLWTALRQTHDPDFQDEDGDGEDDRIDLYAALPREARLASDTGTLRERKARKLGSGKFHVVIRIPRLIPGEGDVPITLSYLPSEPGSTVPSCTETVLIAVKFGPPDSLFEAQVPMTLFQKLRAAFPVEADLVNAAPSGERGQPWQNYMEYKIWAADEEVLMVSVEVFLDELVEAWKSHRLPYVRNKRAGENDPVEEREVFKV